MLSYYLGGMNVADILRINFGEMNGFMSYKRKKTENTAKSSSSTEFEIISKNAVQKNGIKYCIIKNLFHIFAISNQTSTDTGH